VDSLRKPRHAKIISGRDVDKFTIAGLTPVRSDVIVGEIVDVKADQTVLNEHGHPAIDKVKPVIFSPGELVGPAFAIGKELEQ